jgi:predicted nicotinamide N-methyase
VVLTDGHPKCIENNEACAKMMPNNSEMTEVQVEAHLLLWDSSSKGADACRQINKLIRDDTQNNTTDEGLYELCLASDCVHFQEFHDGLLNTIARTLVVGGIALLCQPKRGTSLRNFMALVDAVNSKSSQSSRGPLFQMTSFEDFHPKVSAMHKALMSETFGENNMQYSSQYDPNWHRPLLLVLQKLRPYDEEIDGEQARQHVK